MNTYCVPGNLLGVMIQQEEKVKHDPHSHGARGEQLNRGDIQGTRK